MSCYSTLCTSQTQHSLIPRTPFNRSGYETRLYTVCTMCGVLDLLTWLYGIILLIHGNSFNFVKKQQPMQSPRLIWFLLSVHDLLLHVDGYYAFRKCFSRYVSVRFLRCFSRHVSVSLWKDSKKNKKKQNQNKQQHGQQNKLINVYLFASCEDKSTSRNNYKLF